MKPTTIEVEINQGKITPLHPHLLPEHGRGLLTVLSAAPGIEKAAFFIGIEADGLPVIRPQSGAITSEFVREIEGAGAS